MPERDDAAEAGLEIDGSLPDHLSGRYLWIESSRDDGPRLHSVDLAAGKACSYRQRMSSTRDAGGGSTINLIAFAGRIVSLADGAVAQALAPTLDISAVDLAGHGRGIGA